MAAIKPAGCKIIDRTHRIQRRELNEMNKSQTYNSSLLCGVMLTYTNLVPLPFTQPYPYPSHQAFDPAFEAFLLASSRSSPSITAVCDLGSAVLSPSIFCLSRPSWPAESLAS